MLQNKFFDRILVATPDEEIESFCKKIGAESIITSNRHKRASDRCHEVVLKLEKNKEFFEILTMVQGDEPLVGPKIIDKITHSLIVNKDVYCANGFGEIKIEDLSNKNCIKVIKDLRDNAIYMSRKEIPFDPKVNVNVGKQICVIPFRTEFLKLYSDWQETPLEISESIDMLRVIENGYKVKMIKIKGTFHPVDEPNDIKIVENLLNFSS